MEVRSSRRVRTLVTQMARSGLSANEIAPALVSAAVQTGLAKPTKYQITLITTLAHACATAWAFAFSQEARMTLMLHTGASAVT
jgi:hypothetical protein